MVYRNHIHHQIILFMKKFYLLAAFVLFGFLNKGFAQTTFTATSTGNWSSGATWDINGVPSPVCQDCQITINAGVIVTLDADILLKGNSKLIVGTDGSTAAGIRIPLSVNFPAPSVPAPIPPSIYHRIDLVYGDAASIKLANSNTFVDGSTTGPFDGVFLYVPLGTPNNVSYAPIARVGTSVTLFPNSTSISGPTTITSNGTLPIVLINFDAVLNKNEVDLSWTTAQEINSGHFGVERSVDGNHWQTIGIVAAKGFSSIEVNYSYVDQSPLNGTNYYRLQMVDADGKYKYSEIKVVRGSLTAGLKVFPNPAKDYVNVSIGSDITSSVTIRLVNQNGQLLQEKKLSHAGNTIVSFSVNNYPQGNYLVQIIGSDGTKQTNKILIAR